MKVQIDPMTSVIADATSGGMTTLGWNTPKIQIAMIEIAPPMALPLVAPVVFGLKFTAVYRCRLKPNTAKPRIMTSKKVGQGAHRAA